MAKFHSELVFSLFLILFQIFSSRSVEASSITGEVKMLNEISGKWTEADKHHNAVIFLDDPSFTPSSTLSPVIVKMKDGQFADRILVVQIGQKVLFENADNIYHNVWSLSQAKSFDLGSYKAPVKKEVVFDKPGIVKVFCNVHPEMIMTILVLKSAYFVKTHEDGRFKISDIPPAVYLLKAWAEGSSPITQQIDLKSKDNLKLKLKLKQKLLTTHLDKNGKPYSSY